MVNINFDIVWFILTKKLNLLLYSLSVDHLEYCIMFVCNRKVTLIGVYSKLTIPLGVAPPPPQQAYSTECLLY